MSRVGMRRFLETAANETELSQKFTNAVADLAQREGFDVTHSDVERVLNELASKTKTPNPNEPIATTMAMGEEEKIPFPDPVATSMALGEEDGRASTEAVGEEDDRDDMSLMTDAIPEEDDGSHLVTCAIPEEGPGPR